MARQRSPNYPAMSLPTAIDRIRAIQSAEGKNAAPREVLAKHLGFSGVNGASATMLSALAKYGLLESVADGEAKVSPLAMTILFPHDEDEKQAAIHKAAFTPVLFTRLREKWPDRRPSDDSLRSYLIREGFSQNAADQVIQFYRETLEIAVPREQGQDSPLPDRKEVLPMNVMHQQPATTPVVPQPAVLGKPFTIGFDGDTLTGTIAIRNVRDIDRLIRVLGAQKAAFMAMGEGDSDDQGRLLDEEPHEDVFG